MSKAYIRVTPEVIAGALKMPEGMTIRYMRHDTLRDVLDILVEHPNIPETKPGDSPPEIIATYTQEPGGVTADWGEWFKEEES